MPARLDHPVCSTQRIRLQALTSFCRTNWLPDQTQTVEVDLVRDEHLGLGEFDKVTPRWIVPNRARFAGITVAGYVHRKGKRGYLSFSTP